MPVKSLFFTQFAMLAFLCLPLESNASVWTVGPSHDFSQIQDAVIAANDGDTILVQSGNYDPFVIDGISLNIVANTGATVSIGHTSVVKLLRATQAVNLIGLDLIQFGCLHEGLQLENNLGSVRIEDCNIIGGNGRNCYLDPDYHPDGWDGVTIASCQDVAFCHCNITGGSGGTVNIADQETVGNGAQAVLSTGVVNLVFYHCELRGGDGGNDWDDDNLDGGHGGHACRIAFTDAFFSGSLLRGGDGGAAGALDGSGGDGGNGLYAGLSTQARLLDNTFLGGMAGTGNPAGTPGEGVLGPAEYIQGLAHSVDMICPIKEPSSINIIFRGEPGDMVALLLSPGATSLYISDMAGQWLLAFSPALLVVKMGTIPPSGTHYVSNVTIPDMGPAFDVATFYCQSIFMNPAGQITLGAPRTLIALDQSY